MLDFLLRPSILTPACLILCYLIYRAVATPAKYGHIPILGARHGDWFPFIQAAWRNTFDFKGALVQAYSQYHNEACLLPHFMGPPYMMLPASDLKWAVDQPDSVLDAYRQILDDLQTDYTLMDPDLVHKPAHQKIIVTSLTGQTGNLIPELSDETAHAFETIWGMNTDNWSEVGVYNTVRHLIGRVTNRVFIGLPMCRNEALAASAIEFAQALPITAALLKMVPRLFLPLVAPIITLPTRLYTNRCINAILPEVRRRLSQAEMEPARKLKNDFLQWSITQARQSSDPYLGQPRTLAGRILLLNFASIHTSSIALSGMLLDLICTPEGAACLDELRDEVVGALANQAGVWDKHSLARMVKVESFLRESVRVNSFVTIGLARLCVAPGGCVSPSGARIPKGATVALPSYCLMHDPDLYPDPERVQPLRHVAFRPFAATSPEYLAFGHGRHACPGRFFAAAELKLMFAYAILHYQFQLQPARPDNAWYGYFLIPAVKHTIKIRRRKDPFGDLAQLQPQQ